MQEFLYDFSVYIGRFQPFHNGHLKSIKYALKFSKKLIIVLGGAYASPAIRGPWHFTQRMQMILQSLSAGERKKIYFVAIRDRLYHEEKWIQNVQGEVAKITQNAKKIAIVGHEKDSSSYYLRVFPHWAFLETGNYQGINATDIRNLLFLKNDKKMIKNLVPEKVNTILAKYAKTNEFKALKKKFIFTERNKHKVQNEFVTNIIIYCNTYILLIKSKDILKQGLYSLPEVMTLIPNFEEKVLTYMENEFKIDLHKNELYNNYIACDTFDYSERYPLGRQVSKTYFFKLKKENLPVIMKSQNSLEVSWILIDDLCFFENEMYADHFQIIQYFKKYFD